MDGLSDYRVAADTAGAATSSDLGRRQVFVDAPMVQSQYQQGGGDSALIQKLTQDRDQLLAKKSYLLQQRQRLQKMNQVLVSKILETKARKILLNPEHSAQNTFNFYKGTIQSPQVLA